MPSGRDVTRSKQECGRGSGTQVGLPILCPPFLLTELGHSQIGRRIWRGPVPGPAPTDSGSIDVEWGLDIRTFLNSPGDSHVQPELGDSDLSTYMWVRRELYKRPKELVPWTVSGESSQWPGPEVGSVGRRTMFLWIPLGLVNFVPHACMIYPKSKFKCL